MNEPLADADRNPWPLYVRILAVLHVLSIPLGFIGFLALCLAAGVGYQLEVASGDPTPTLLEIVERYGCDAVIMGAETQGALSSALLGSVAHDLVQACPVPVTVVRPPPPAEPADDGVAEDSEASA